MDKLKDLAESLIMLTKEELAKLATLLHHHPENGSKIGIMADGDPVPPNPTHPPG